MKVLYSLPTLACLSIVASAPAAELKGAATALKRVEEQKGASTKLSDPGSVFVTKLETFKRGVASMPAAEGAAGWIRLMNEYLAMPPQIRRAADGQEFSFTTLLSALPDPDGWPAIREALASRNDKQQPALSQSLQLFASALLNDLPAQDQAIKAIEASLPRLENLHEPAKRYLSEIAQLHLARSGDRVGQIEQFEKQLQMENSGQREGLTVPDLVLLAGEKRATEILTKVLTEKTLVIERIEGNATKRLAARLGKELLDQLKVPQWALVSSPEDTELYDAIAAKFKGWKEQPLYLYARARQRAARSYLASLISKGRTEDAAKFANETTEARETIDVSGILEHFDLPVQSVKAFLQALLEMRPSTPAWEEFIKASAQAGESAKALEFLRKTGAREDVPEATRRAVLEHLSSALLAADQIEEGARALRQRIMVGAPPSSTNTQDTPSRSDTEGLQDAAKAAVQLARLGKLMERPEWIQAGTAALKTTVGRLVPLAPNGYVVSELNGDLIKLLEDQGKTDEAEEVLVADLLAASRPPSPDSFPDETRGFTPLSNLASFYGRNGRHQDVLELLSSAEGWAVEDLSGVLKDAGFDDSIAVDAANSLLALGQKEEAKRIIEAYLLKKTADDRAYEIRLKIGGNDVIPLLEKLATLDRFEERPLIWKAKLQLDAGNVAEAEKTIRAAISIDPSDGEQGKGDRMRAYTVLGDILEKKGDMETAKFMRGAVRAIRASEDADDWWSAGLLSRAVKLYEQALTHFADAYCIESRLALRYADIGLMELAEQHYRRAYELMPDSFGRIESHCFGCEGAFKGSHAQGVAERVFTKLAERSPDKPQIHYLLGYLRMSQSRNAEAVESFRRAVKLDPDYFNAWQNLVALAQGQSIPQAEVDSASFNLLRLDPLRRHAGSGYGDIADLRSAWRVAAIAIKAQPSIPDRLLSLPAAKLAIERRKQKEATGTSASMFMRFQSSGSPWSTPGDILAANSYLNYITNFIDLVTSGR